MPMSKSNKHISEKSVSRTILTEMAAGKDIHFQIKSIRSYSEENSELGEVLGGEDGSYESLSSREVFAYVPMKISSKVDHSVIMETQREYA